MTEVLAAINEKCRCLGSAPSLRDGGKQYRQRVLDQFTHAERGGFGVSVHADGETPTVWCTADRRSNETLCENAFYRQTASVGFGGA